MEIEWVSDSDPKSKQQIIETITSEYSKLEEFVFDELVDISGKQLTKASLRRVTDAFREHALRGEGIEVPEVALDSSEPETSNSTEDHEE